MKKFILLPILILFFYSFTTSPFRTDGDKVIFKMENNDLSKVTIRVTDSDCRSIYTEVIEKEPFIGRVFNFESAFEDKYTIEVEDNDTKYIKYVKIKY